MKMMLREVERAEATAIEVQKKIAAREKCKNRGRRTMNRGVSMERVDFYQLGSRIDMECDKEKVTPLLLNGFLQQNASYVEKMRRFRSHEESLKTQKKPIMTKEKPPRDPERLFRSRTTTSAHGLESLQT